MLAGIADCGRSWKWGCRGRLVLGFKPRRSSHARGNHMPLGLPLPCSLGSWKARCSSDAELFLNSLEEGRRDSVGRKGVKGLLLVAQKVPCGFGLRTGGAAATQLMVLGTLGGLTAEHGLLGRTGGYLSHRLLFLFLRYGTLDWEKGGRKDCVCLWMF